MAHTLENADLSPEESLYLDYMQKGDDFMKISIYRSAKEWYTKALELKNNHESVQSKLDECNRLIQYEKKIIIAVVSIIAIVLLAAVLF